ncbi:hypothetical protein H6A09_03570 [[Clostridium] spiroforme]|nr:hypothetical protein [Thomasclavelia spiroformis]
MNWVMSLVFLCIIPLTYYVIGRKMQLIFCLENGKNDLIRTCLIGFFVVFFISFIVGLPCQFFHLNWVIYKYTYLFLLILIIIYSVYTEKENYIGKKNEIISTIVKHIKYNWFIYFLCVIFLFFALTNILMYYQNNYDDAYYLGKVINQIGAKQLSMENYYNGSLTNGALDITRVLNTYEITYGFFSTIFHISPVFFCRVTMAVHNYVLVFFVYKLLAQFFVKNNISQYCLLPFVFLIISSGYAMEGNTPFSINMFDGWQFQSAIWYGGSVVRTIAIPTILIFSESLIERFYLKNIVFLCIVYVTFLSFSTIFLIYGIIVTLLLFISKGLIQLNDGKIKNKIKKIDAILCIVIPIFLLFFSKLIDKLSFIGTANYYSNLSNYIDFSNWYFYGDTFIYYALALFILSYFIFKSTMSKFVSIFMILVFLIVFTKLFYELIIVSSGFFWFVGLRFSTSIQLMLTFMIGCLILYLFDKFFNKKFIIGLFSLVLTFSVLSYIYTHIEEIKQQNWLASGMTEYGYSIYPLIKNDEMMPNVMCEVGAYFNNKEYGNYPLLVPESMNWDGYPMYTNGFVFASNRIELCTNNGANNLSKDQLDLLYKYYSNECNYSDIAKILSDHNINYILVQDKNQMDDLIRNGWTLEISSDKINETYYLLKK